MRLIYWAIGEAFRLSLNKVVLRFHHHPLVETQTTFANVEVKDQELCASMTSFHSAHVFVVSS